MRRAEAALKAYDDATAADWKAFDEAIDDADDATAAAWKAFDEAIAPAARKLWT